MSDRRDPTKLGEALLAARARHGTDPDVPLSLLHDRMGPNTNPGDYENDEGPVEKYGDPRELPTTSPEQLDG